MAALTDWLLQLWLKLVPLLDRLAELSAAQAGKERNALKYRLVSCQVSAAGFETL